MLDYLYFFFEAMAFVVAVLQASKMKGTPYIYFVPYLLFTVIYEFGTLQRWFSVNHSNHWAANINFIVFFLFNALFLVTLLRTRVFKNWAGISIWASLLLSLLNMAFFQGFWHLNSATILLQLLILIIFSCLYFYELLHYTAAPISMIRLPGFWLNTGLLIYCILNFLFFASFTYMAYKNNYSYFLLAMGISNLSVGILYSCLAICFICFSKRPQLIID